MKQGFFGVILFLVVSLSQWSNVLAQDSIDYPYLEIIFKTLEKSVQDELIQKLNLGEFDRVKRATQKQLKYSRLHSSAAT